MANKKKITTGIIAGVTAVALALGGTFAWQSISQTALNEKEATINPGGRLHDDFDGTNKDVYVENFADEDIFARIRLSEYFEITMNKNTPAETTEQIIGSKEDLGDAGFEYAYEVHKFGTDETRSAEYWNWTTGGSTVYMPTFNKNKDSLVADINGTFENNYEDYVEYEDGDMTSSTAIYDSDSNSLDEVGKDFDNLDDYVTAGNIKTITEDHTAKETETAKFISMEDWLQLAENGEDTDNYWVYDDDGWVYWSSPIKADTATGLLLDEISLTEVMDDSYYYAINVEGQFITADDLGKDDNTGFYDDDSAPTENALKLLEKIGVKVDNDTADDDTDNTEDGDGTKENPYKLTANLTVKNWDNTEVNGTLTYSNERGAWIYNTEDGVVGFMSTDIKDGKGNTIEVDEYYDYNYIHRFELNDIVKLEIDDGGNDRYRYENEKNVWIITSCVGRNFVEFYRETFTGEQEFTMHIEYNKNGVYYKSEPIKIIVTGSKVSD